MFRWMKEPQKRTAPKGRPSSHRNPRGFERQEPTELPDPEWRRGQDDDVDHAAHTDGQAADDSGEEWL